MCDVVRAALNSQVAGCQYQVPNKHKHLTRKTVEVDVDLRLSTILKLRE